jgi:hypothetical protein
MKDRLLDHRKFMGAAARAGQMPQAAQLPVVIVDHLRMLNLVRNPVIEQHRYMLDVVSPKPDIASIAALPKSGRHQTTLIIRISNDEPQQENSDEHGNR